MTDLQNSTIPPLAYSECYVQPFFTFYNADNMDIMKHYPDKYFDLAIVDPPYGIGIDGQKENKKKVGYRKAHDFKGWDNEIPTSEYFAELERVSKNQIVWGANYFVEHLHKGTKGWVVWYKGQEGLTMSDAELAYSSFNCATRVIKINRVELLKDGTIHPTQKPVKLYEWIIKNYANDNDKIIDTHLGSGSIAIAIDKANTLDKKNLTFVGIELDPEYYRAAVERFKNHKRQCVLF